MIGFWLGREMGEEEAKGGPVIPESVLKKQKRSKEWTLARSKRLRRKRRRMLRIGN